MLSSIQVVFPQITTNKKKKFITEHMMRTTKTQAEALHGSPPTHKVA
jgi:hypothetical protein